MLLLLAGSLQAARAATGPAPMLTLADGAGPVALNASLTFLLDGRSTLRPEQVEAMADSEFAPLERHKPLNLGTGALWIRFDAVVKNPAERWRLAVTFPGVDSASLYFRDAKGQWSFQQAGDSLGMERWPLQGRYPVFSLNQENGQPTRYLVRIQHERAPFSAALQISNDTRLIQDRQAEYMLLGIYFGLAALVTVLALANAVAYRDLGFASYAVYVALFAATQGVFSGVAGLFWWPQWPMLNNSMAVLIPVSATAAALWFVRTVTLPRRFSRALDWMLLGLMLLLPLLGLLDMGFPTLESFAMLHILVATSMTMLWLVLGVTLFERDRHARWVALGFVPVLLATVFPLLRNLGVIASDFWTEYALMLGSAIQVPVLFYGLHRRVSQRREPTARATALRTTDPLTGLHSVKVLLTKLRQALGMAERYQQPFALLMVNLTNLGQLQNQHGRQTGERAMVMAAARIRAVARPTDTVARAGDAQFALLMEGPVSATAANDVATRILASGLRPSNELPDSQALQFHIAVGHLGNTAGAQPDDSDNCFARMQQALRDMNDGSRKAIRLVNL